MSSTFGNYFKITTWGESHGKAVGVVVDGCPAGLEISPEEIQLDLDKRRPGQSKITTQRKELDKVEILSGVFEGKTTGTPISMIVQNADQKSQDYSEIKDVYRPSHADYTYDERYGFRDYRGGGRSSARETIGRVAASTLARKILKEVTQTEILAYVSQIKDSVFEGDPTRIKRESVEASIVRCPDPGKSKEMEKIILEARKQGDSVGGVISFYITGVAKGLGSPVFHRTEAELARAFLSIPATKGFEIGSGFGGTKLTGSQHNDAFVNNQGNIETSTNHSGGVQGGITNGMPIYGRIAFKPTATIMQPQNTVNQSGEPVTLVAKGRHDPCVLPRAVIIVEAMAALTLVDLMMEYRSTILK